LSFVLSLKPVTGTAKKRNPADCAVRCNPDRAGREVETTAPSGAVAIFTQPLELIP
jgi:hypothetical protein